MWGVFPWIVVDGDSGGLGTAAGIADCRIMVSTGPSVRRGSCLCFVVSRDSLVALKHGLVDATSAEDGENIRVAVDSARWIGLTKVWRQGLATRSVTGNARSSQVWRYAASGLWCGVAVHLLVVSITVRRHADFTTQLLKLLLEPHGNLTRLVKIRVWELCLDLAEGTTQVILQCIKVATQVDIRSLQAEDSGLEVRGRRSAHLLGCAALE